MKTAAEIMLRDFPRIDKDETLEHAVRIMEKYESDRVLAFEEERLVGIMTKKDIMMKLATLRTRNLVPGRLHVSSFMTPDPKTVEPGLLVGEVAKRMVGDGVGSYPVVDSGKVVGLVTRWEVASLVSDLAPSSKAADVMVVLPEVLRPTNKVLHARTLLTQYNMLFIPVVDEEGRPVGYVTVDEVADAFLAFHDIVAEKYRKERIEHLFVDDIMRLRPPVVSPDTSLPEVFEAIKRKRSKGAIVMHDEKLVGVVTLEELVRVVAAKA